MITARTPKEKLALQIWNKLNEIAIEKGEKVEEEIDGIYFVRSNSGRSATIDNLERMLRAKTRTLEEIRLNKKIAAYWETEEGKARKADLEARIDVLQKAYAERKQEYKNNVEQIVQDVLGLQWGVCNWASETNLRIAMIDPKNRNEYIFGATIDVSLRDGIEFKDGDWVNEEHFEANVGTMGSFDILGVEKDDYSRASFYAGLGRLLGFTGHLRWIKKEMIAFKEYGKIVDKEVEPLQAQLNNPFAE